MELQEIDLFIEPDGQVRLEVRGVQGAQCLLVTKELEAILGGEITTREMTPEANAEASAPLNQREREGQR